MDESDRYVRAEVEACALCAQSDAPYAFLEDQRHYCIRCARRKLVTEKVQPAGRRTNDLTLDDVLWHELPLPPDLDLGDENEISGASD